MKYLKFRMPTKNVAYAVKNVIISTAMAEDYITKSEVLKICPETYETNENDKTVGWRASDLHGNNIKVVMAKIDGNVKASEDKIPWLYICEPTVTITNFLEKSPGGNSENKSEDQEFINYLVDALGQMIKTVADSRRKAMVHHKLNKKTVVERPCWFHQWTTNRVQKEDGTIVDQDLAICEFLDDGHVERVAWDHIRFVEAWD